MPRHPRLLRPAAAVLLGLAISSLPVAAWGDAGFDRWVEGVSKDARRSGLPASAVKRALSGLTPDPAMERLTRRQPELVKPIGGYIESRAGGTLLKRGRAKVAGQKGLLSRIERRTGVDPYVVAAIWGLETGFGANIGSSDVFRSLATLGHMEYRGDFFRNELIDAIRVMHGDRVPRARMIGSWAGAMGQTQFIPSSFLKFAVDGDGDGRRDPWSSVADALMSTANYLKQKGWIPGQPWGFEVTLPRKLERAADTAPWWVWKEAGVKARNGRPFPKEGEATLFFPAGEEGPAFLITPNYEVIRDYNSSDAYSLSAALLAEGLRGRKRAPARWPKDRTLNKAERMEVQERLAKRGFAVPNRTGRILKGVRFAIRDFQRSIGVTADGYPDLTLLRQLRAR